MRQVSELPDTPSRLLEATITMIDAGGEGSVRLRDIAAAAGVTLPSIYHFFGSRDGLIEEAQATRYARTQEGIVRAFTDAVSTCKSKRSFLAVVRRFIMVASTPERTRLRSVRLEVLGSAQSRPGLAERLAEHQRAANEALAVPLRVAQRRGWMRHDVDAVTVGAWVIAVVSGRLFAETDPKFDDLATWDALSVDAVLAIMEPPRSRSR